MQQRADLIKLYVDGGIANIKEIRKHYNRFDEGGIKDTFKPQYWFTPKYEANSLKEAIYHAYDDGRKGKKTGNNKE